MFLIGLALLIGLSLGYTMITPAPTVGFLGQKTYLMFSEVQNGLGSVAVREESLC